MVFDRQILRQFALPRIERAASEALGLDFRVGEADIDFSGGIVLGSVAASGPSPSTGIRGFSVRKIEVSFSIPGLVSGKPNWLREIRIFDPVLDVALDHRPFLPDLGGGEEPAPPAEGPPAPLPAVSLTGGVFTVRDGSRVLHVTGVDATLDAPRATLRIASGEGNWTPPRVSVLPFPVELDAELALAPAPFSSIAVRRFALGGKEITRDLAIDLTRPGLIDIAGALPGWNVPRANVGVDLARDLLDIRVRTERADIRSIVRLFTDWECPAGLGTGDFHLVLPLKKLADWRAESAMEVEDVSWPVIHLTADALSLHGRRGDDGITEGFAVVVGARLPTGPRLDVMTPFRREPAEGGAWRIVFGDLAIHAGQAAVRGAASLREGDLLIEDAALILDTTALGSLAEAYPAMPRFHRGEARLELFFEGAAEDPASYDASIDARVFGLERAVDSPPMDILARADLRGCQLLVEEALWMQREDTVRMSLAAGVGFPILAELTSLSGRLAGFPFEVRDLPVIEHDESGWVVKPSSLDALGGVIEFALEWQPGRDVNAWVSAREVRIAALLGRFDVPGDPEGILACDIAVAGAVGGDRLAPEANVHVRIVDAAWGLNEKRITGVGIDVRVRAEEEELLIVDALVNVGPDWVRTHAEAPIVWTPAPLPAPGGRARGMLEVDVSEVAAYPFLRGRGLRELGGGVRAEGSFSAELSANAADIVRSTDLEVDLNVRQGVIKPRGDLPPLSGIQGHITVGNSGAVVRKITGRVRDAPFDVAGSLAVQWPWNPGGAAITHVDLELTSKNAVLFRTKSLRIRGDVGLRWKGPWTRSTLEGGVQITRAYYVQNISLAPGRGPSRPLQLFSFQDEPLRSVRLNLGVRADRTVIIRNNLVSTRATADLRLTGTGYEPALSGTISTDEGRVSLGNAGLDIANAYVEFLESDPLNPRLNILLEDEIRSYTVTVSITGTAREPEVLLDSSPPLEREQILVLISTGMTLEEIEGEGAERVAAVQAAVYLGRRIARYFSGGDPTEKSFFDRFSLQSESARTARYEDPIRVEFQVVEDVILDQDEVFLQGERDTYGDYNFNVGIRFELE